MIRQVFSNLKRQNIKSENLKNFGAIKVFMNLQSPLVSQGVDLIRGFPFGPV